MLSVLWYFLFLYDLYRKYVSNKLMDLLQGYFNALRLEKMMSNLKVTLLCPGPVFSNFLSESFTGKPGEVIRSSLLNLIITHYINCEEISNKNTGHGK